MKKQYLDYAGLKRVLKHLLPGARKIWHGTLNEWKTLSEAERDKYDQAEVIDGSGYQSDVVRDLLSPDWTKAVEISAKELAAGYKVPADGMIVGSVIPAPGINTLKLFCNGILLSEGTNNTNTHSSSYLHSHTIVNAGDAISITPPSINSFSSKLSFVPFHL